MNQREAFIEVARNEIGYVEGPKDNQTKYGRFTKRNFLPWCGSFVMWCADKVDLKIPNVVSTQAGALAFKKQKRFFKSERMVMAEPGDLAFMDFPHDGLDRISHIGIVVRDNGDGTVVTIEGNTAPDKRGDQRNGGEVCRKVRRYRKTKLGSIRRRSIPVTIVGFGKPKFKEINK